MHIQARDHARLHPISTLTVRGNTDDLELDTLLYSYSNGTEHAQINSARYPSLDIGDKCLPASVDRPRDWLGSSIAVLGDHVRLHIGAC